MTYETLWTGIGGGLLIPILGKLNLFHLIIQLVIDVKWIGLCLMKNHLDHLFPQIWISALAVSLLLKLPVRKLEPIFVLWKIRCLKCVQIRSLFWSLFSRIRTEYGEILRISPYSVRMRENTDQKKPCVWTLFTQWSFFKDYILSQ